MFMQNDEQIWNTIGKKKHCAFKTKTPTITLCKNPYNVSGTCDRKSCPLANSKYATVREENNNLFLYLKEPERTLKPQKMYEKIKLSENYEKAMQEISENLKYWDEDLILKCKRKMTKLYKMFLRKQNIKKEKLIKINKKEVKIKEVGAKLALKDVQIHKNIEEELISRLKSGIYGKEFEDEVKLRDEKEKIRTTKRQFIAEFEESEEINAKTETKKKKQKNTETIIW